MRGYPLSLEKGAELCTAINISILHKFENTKHKRFGRVGRYVFGVSCICYFVGSNLQLILNLTKSRFIFEEIYADNLAVDDTY